MSFNIAKDDVQNAFSRAGEAEKVDPEEIEISLFRKILTKQ